MVFKGRREYLEQSLVECVEPSVYKTAKNGRKMFWCTCASCGIKKYGFVKSEGLTTAKRKPSGLTTVKRKPAKRKTNTKGKGLILGKTALLIQFRF